MRSLIWMIPLTCLILFSRPAMAGTCELEDNGTGTIDLLPECPDGYEGMLTIVDGLPPGTTITGPAAIRDYRAGGRIPEGPIGAEYQYGSATLYWQASGTGDLAGFERSLVIPLVSDSYTGPRNPGDPVQTFGAEFLRLDGPLLGDPDFDTLTFEAGFECGLPATSGWTTLTQLPSGDFAVDSFFDITYRIEFQGAPGSILEGLGGSTIGTERYQAGEEYHEPIDHSCQLPDNGNGTVDLLPECPDGYEGTLTIIDGLPPGTTITGPAAIRDYVVLFRNPDGEDGSELQYATATLYWQASGTGDFLGFERSLAIPLPFFDSGTGPPDPGFMVQSYDSELLDLNGQLSGDPDFCELIIRAGSSQGMPSPGSTTLVQLPGGDFAVDSFFDITYQIDFEGCPGSILEGLTGSTIQTERYQAGEEYVTSAPDGIAARRVELLQNVPNPFNPTTTIRYELPAGGSRVRLQVYDLSGRFVCTLVDARQEGGVKSALWSGTDAQGRKVSSGVYFYELTTDAGSRVRKMVMLK